MNTEENKRELEEMEEEAYRQFNNYDKAFNKLMEAREQGDEETVNKISLAMLEDKI